MSRTSYDAVVVGARVAGAATAMLLARDGLKVLLIDRSRYGSDTVSTHALMRAGVLQLHRWGLLERVTSAGAPPVRRTIFHYESGDVRVSIKPTPGVDALFAPRRTTLDRVLVDAAAEAGVDVRFGLRATGVLRDASGRVTGVVGQDGGGRTFAFEAAVTIGADGLRSTVASAVQAPAVRVGSASTTVLYGYWPGVEAEGYEWFYRAGAGAGFIPTEQDLTCVFVGTSPDRFRELDGPAPSRFARLLEQVAPGVGDRLRGPAEGGLRGFPGAGGYLRRPYGPGWALVGDAGYFKDPISTHGITDALRDAELLAGALSPALRDRRDPTPALTGYQEVRDRLSMPLFEATERVAAYDWDEQALRRHLLALSSAMTDELEELHQADVQISPSVA